MVTGCQASNTKRVADDRRGDGLLRRCSSRMAPVPSIRVPQSAGNGRPSRLLAVASAALVTVLTVGGSLGMIPGVSAQQPAIAAAGGKAAATADAGPYSNVGADSQGVGSEPDPLKVEEKPAAAGAESDEVVSETFSDGYALPAKSGEGKRIVYDISEQHTWLVGADNSVVRHYPVSGGRDESLLDPGRYDVYSKSRHAVAFNQRETMNYMVRFSHGDYAAIGFHDVPAFDGGTLAQSRDELGTPRSAGCIRQWITDARALWRFSEVGTSVVVKA